MSNDLDLIIGGLSINQPLAYLTILLHEISVHIE
jgi:hypothetical protein